MKYKTLIGIAAAIICTVAFPLHGADASLKALLITGQNNHNWQLSHPVLKTILEDTGLFSVDLALTPPQGGDMSVFTPAFGDYHVVVLDYNGDDWPESTRAAFLEYVRNGGGVVVYHAANNAFPEWPEFNEVIGLGGWGNRNERHGPYVRWEDGELIRDMRPGPGGAHGRQHRFVVVHRDLEHPITRGLPETWLHEQDELYHHLRGPANNMKLLATAWSDPATGGTGNHEPILFTIAYGEGRVFQTALGHAGEDPPPALQCVGFIVTLQRGAEWAATGAVTQPVPADFPTEDEVRLRPRFRQDSLASFLEELASYTYNDSLEPLVMLQEVTRSRMAAGASLADLEDGYIALLQSDAATRDAKQFACKQLGLVGTEKAADVLAGLLHDEALASMARFALERIPGRESLRALRAALPLASAEHRAGLLSSLGARRDARAVALIDAHLHDGDVRVANAAVEALASIGTRAAADLLLNLADSENAEFRLRVRDGYIRCGFALLEAGKIRAAEKVFATADTRFADDPRMRAAALRGRVALEGQASGKVILEALETGDPELQAVAAAAARNVDSPSDLIKIAGYMRDLPPQTQVVLITALQEAKAIGLLEHLIEAAQSDHEEVRIAALQALGVIGPVEAAPFLLTRASNSAGREQAAARQSLARLHGATPALLDMLRSEDVEVKSEAIKAVVARRVSGATPILLEELARADSARAMELVQALTEIAEPEYLDQILPLLLQAQAASDAAPVLDIVAGVMERAGESDAQWKPLADALETEQEPAARRNLYLALGKVGDAAVLPLLAKGFDEPDASVRLAAVEGLAGWRDEAALGLLLEAATRFQNSPEGSAAITGYLRVTGLDAQRDAKATAELYLAVLPLASRSEDMQACIAALGRTGSEAALPALYDALENASSDVAVAAARALAAWPDAAPMARLETLAKEGPEALRVEGLRGYFRLIGINKNISGEEAVERYREALALAPTPAEQKRILAGLATAENMGALLVASECLANPDLRDEAEVAVVRIAGNVVNNHPAEVQRILQQVEANAESAFIKDEIAKVYEKIKQFQDYIVLWEMSGPFTVGGGSMNVLFDTAFPPEQDPDSAEWTSIAVGTNSALPFLVELDKALGGDNRVAYLRTRVWSDADRGVVLETGSDDGNKVWLNGDVVHANNAVRPAAPGQDRAEVSLKQGWNNLLVKVTQGGGEWSFCARFRNPDGTEVPGLRVSLHEE